NRSVQDLKSAQAKLTGERQRGRDRIQRTSGRASLGKPCEPSPAVLRRRKCRAATDTNGGRTGERRLMNVRPPRRGKLLRCQGRDESRSNAGRDSRGDGRLRASRS